MCQILTAERYLLKYLNLNSNDMCKYLLRACKMSLHDMPIVPNIEPAKRPVVKLFMNSIKYVK